MSRYDYPDASLATIAPLTEEQLAGQRARAGDKVRFAHGRYWREFGSGFWEALHWLARMTEGEARRPGPCWGYRATLDDAAADGANASLPLHLIVDIAAHDESALPRDARYDLRRLARRGVRIVQLTDMRLFGDQGYEVMLDWRRRVGLAGPTPTRAWPMPHRSGPRWRWWWTNLKVCPHKVRTTCRGRRGASRPT